MKEVPINVDVLFVELAKKRWTQLELARRLDRPPSTLSCWLRGVAPCPPDLAARIEVAMSLPEGTLAMSTTPPSDGAPSA